MLREAIYHRPKQNWAYAYDNNTVHIRVRTRRNDMTEVNLIAGDKYAWEQTNRTVPMALLSSDELFDYWEVAVQPPYRRLQYAFHFYDGKEHLYRIEKSFLPAPPPNGLNLFDFPFVNPVDVFAPPAWVKDAVFYQIFPERFANGDPSLNPEQVEPWGGKPTPTNFFGGDLQGVIDHLDHLVRLGVNAIYFNPLFEATTNHKYDTKNYLKVDPHFGTNEKLKELVEACHARGIKVMLDAVFNHSGKEFPPFVDVLEKGASSAYKEWFHVREFPLRIVDRIPTYDTFGFEPIMPKLNTENSEVKSYLLDVARYWIEEVGIDGWRLDVANEVDHAFWREFRMAVKTLNPDVYILGEIWHDSIMWLQGDQFDAVMNYPFTNAALDFFAYGTSDAKQFADAVGAQLAAYPQQATETTFNLLGSHDTPRLLTLCEGDTNRMKLATLFKLTYPGTACVYYGDEVGMTGGGDPGCRECMVWEEDKQDKALFAFFSEAIRLRKEHEALRSAGFRFLQAEAGSGLLVYERRASDGGERFVIVMNVSEKAADVSVPVAAGEGWTNAFTGERIVAARGCLQANVPAYGYVVWRQ
jgi:glycosidase